MDEGPIKRRWEFFFSAIRRALEIPWKIVTKVTKNVIHLLKLETKFWNGRNGSLWLLDNKVRRLEKHGRKCKIRDFVKSVDTEKWEKYELRTAKTKNPLRKHGIFVDKSIATPI